jgi:hypothetical protein
VSYTPTSDIHLRQWAFTGKRDLNPVVSEVWAQVAWEEDYGPAAGIFWEIRKADMNDMTPDQSAGGLLATGMINIDVGSVWELGHIVDYTISMVAGVDLEGGETYFFIVGTNVGDYVGGLMYPIFWADTYQTGDEDEVDDGVYCAVYIPDVGWLDGLNTYNLSLGIPAAQAGKEWHLVMNGKGYMTPDDFRSYQVSQVSAGLAGARGGQSEYSQLRYPYSNFSQSSWEAGVGQLSMSELDQRAFLYGLSLDTLTPSQAIIGPKVHVTGLAGATLYTDPDPSVVITLGSSYGVVLMEQRFTTGVTGYTAPSLGIRACKHAEYSGATLKIALWSSVAGVPGTNLTGNLTLSPSSSWDWCDVPTGINLAPQTEYIIVLSCVGGNLGEFMVSFAVDGVGGPLKAFLTVNMEYYPAPIRKEMPYNMGYRVDKGQGLALNGDVTGFAHGSVDDVAGFYCIAGKVAYVWDEATKTWSSLGKTFNVNCTDIICFDNNLYVAQGRLHPMYKWDGTTWTVANTTNLAVNETFETGVVPWGHEDGVVYTSEMPAVGLNGKALKVAATGTATSWGSHSMRLEKNRSYILSFYHLHVPAADGNERMRIGFTSNSGDLYEGVVGEWDADTAWTKREIILYVHEDGNTGTTKEIWFTTVLAAGAAGRHTWFDEWKVVQQPTATVLGIGKGFLWANLSPNEVVHTSNGKEWSARVVCGESISNVTGFTNYGGNFLVGKEDGIWQIDDQDMARQYTLFRGQQAPNNCKGWEVWSGVLFLPVQTSLWRWQTSSYKEVGPTDGNTGPTLKWPNSIRDLASISQTLWAASSPQGLSTGEWGGLHAYNASGWHQLARHTETDASCLAVYATSVVGNEYRVWFGQGKRVAYIRLPNYMRNRWDWPDADYDTRGATMVTSWWDGGLKDALKYWNRVTFFANIPEGTSIEVYFARDGKDWENLDQYSYLGSLNSESIRESGQYVVRFPEGLVAKSIQLILKFATRDSTKTPRLKAYNIESIVRQIPADTYQFRILMADNVQTLNKSRDTRTSEDIWNELVAARAQDQPITISFPWRSLRGIISFLSEGKVSFNPKGSQGVEWERVANVTVTEVK